MIQKTVNIKAKVGLRFSVMVRDLDIRCPKNHCLFHATLAKIQIQGFNTKKSKPKEFRPTESKPAKSKTLALSHFKFTDPGETFCIDKKREYLKKK